MKRLTPWKKSIANLAIMTLLTIAAWGGSAAAGTDIWISQASGKNTSTTTGTVADPFKSITYAMLSLAKWNAETPWTLHVKTGVYDADTAKPAGERELFPIELRNGITIAGEDGADKCILSGKFNPDSPVPIMRGKDVAAVTIKNLTFQNMNRTSGYGGAFEFINSDGNIEGCTFNNNISIL